ncbi:MAG: sulfatase-like hydrolase/transferase [Chloroflexota bacterium]
MTKRTMPFVFLVMMVGLLAPQRTLPRNLNIFLMYTDDQRWDTLCVGPHGLTEICALPAEDHPMPFIEEIAADGQLFTNAFASTPNCCPARASLLSGGFYAHHHGVLTNDRPNGSVYDFVDTTTLATLLQEQGYKTALIGKYMNRYQEYVDENGLYVPPGWDLFLAFYNTVETEIGPYRFVEGSSTPTSSSTGVFVDVNDGTYLADYMRARAIQFINDNCCDTPIFLFFSTHGPHPPAVPAPRHTAEGLYADFVYRDRSWGEEDLSDKPAYVQREDLYWTPGLDDTLHVDMLRSLQALDEAAEAIISTFNQLGEGSQTVMLFGSDNGYLWQEHKTVGKRKPYEESIRVPLILHLPGFAPSEIEALVSPNIDLGPTILDIAGVYPAGVTFDGRSLLPLVQDPNTPWRAALLLETYAVADAPAWTGIRTSEYKYVEYVTGERELYDLAADPYEMENKVRDPAYAAVVADMAAGMRSLGIGLFILTQNFPDPQTADLPTGYLGQDYSFQLFARGGLTPYIWNYYQDAAYCTGDLPPGLTVSAEGLINGAPSETGVWEFCVQVQDSSVSPQPGNTQPQAVILKVSLAAQ